MPPLLRTTLGKCLYARRAAHGLRPEARSHLAWLRRPAAGSDSVPPAAVPMQKRMQRAPSPALFYASAVTDTPLSRHFIPEWIPGIEVKHRVLGGSLTVPLAAARWRNGR